MKIEKKKASKKNNNLKVFSIIISVAIFLFLVWVAILMITSDSERMLGNKIKEKEFKFNASEYPLVIDKTRYPELSAFENSIFEEYEIMLQNFAEGYRKWGYECFSSPSISKLNFAYLKPSQDIYKIESFCGVPGETSPYTEMPNIMFSIKQGDILMFYQKNITSHFTETFNNIENLDELKEYSKLYVDNLAIDLNSALNNSLLNDLNSAKDFEKDCPLLSDIPELTSTVSKEGNGFVYEGLKIEEELHARLYYLKYSITSDGQVIKDKEEMLAMCQNMGIIY